MTGPVIILVLALVGAITYVGGRYYEDPEFSVSRRAMTAGVLLAVVCIVAGLTAPAHANDTVLGPATVTEVAPPVSCLDGQQYIPTLFDAGSGEVVQPGSCTPWPLHCLDLERFVPPTATADFTCATLPVGGYLPGDMVVIPHRGAFLVSAQFLDLVARYFQPQDQRWAIRSAACESEFKEAADNGHGYGGYWQHRIKDFPAREAAAIKWWAAQGVTWTGRGVFNGESNAATTAWLLATAGKSQWTCKGNG